MVLTPSSAPHRYAQNFSSRRIMTELVHFAEQTDSKWKANITIDKDLLAKAQLGPNNTTTPIPSLILKLVLAMLVTPTPKPNS